MQEDQNEEKSKKELTSGFNNSEKSWKNRMLDIWEKNKNLFKKVGKWIAIILVLFFCAFAIVRISRPLILSLAHYIIKLEQDDKDEYRSREVTVDVERVEKRTMPKYINTIGELKANRSVVIHSEINGIIKDIAFVEGSQVSDGDLLIKFDDSSFQAELRSYQAQYQIALAEFERFKKMRESGAGSIKDFDKAQGEMNVAKSKMEMAEAQLKKTEIRAPFSGTIGLIDVGVGSFVQPNQELVTLVDQTPIKVKFGIPGKFVNEVGVGQVVTITIDANNTEFRGIVEAVDSHVDSATNSVSLRASVPNESGELKAGLFASVRLVIGEQGDIITVDESAVERIGEQEFVWVVDNGRARRVGVLTGVKDKDRTEIIAGLKAGQVVVTAGQLRLFEGSWVKVKGQDLDTINQVEATE